MSSWLTELNVGDEVAVIKFRYGPDEYSRGKVVRYTTNTLDVRVGNNVMKFNRRDGILWGSGGDSYSHPPRLAEFNEQRWVEAQTKIKAYSIAKILERVAWRELSLFQLEQVYALIKTNQKEPNNE